MLPTIHMVVKNEDIFIWYAIQSVLKYSSQILIFDTGSTDNTVQMIKSIRSEKIIFKQKGSIDNKELVKLRQEQIDQTKTDWFWVVDGDEIYPKITADEVSKFITNGKDRYEGGVVRRYDLLGDIYHYQSETVGEYNLFGQKGHLVLRLLNKKKLPLLHLSGIYPNEGYYDQNNEAIIDHPRQNFFITGNRLFHAMYLPRSTKGGSLKNTLHRNKVKIEDGHPFSASQNFPDVFFRQRPLFVPSVIEPRSRAYEIKAKLITPLKKFKRKIWSQF